MVTKLSEKGVEMLGNGVLPIARHASPMQAPMIPEFSQGSTLKNGVHGSIIGQKMYFSKRSRKLHPVLLRKVQNDRDGFPDNVFGAKNFRFHSVDGSWRETVAKPGIITRSVKERGKSEKSEISVMHT